MGVGGYADKNGLARTRLYRRLRERFDNTYPTLEGVGRNVLVR